MGEVSKCFQCFLVLANCRLCQNLPMAYGGSLGVPIELDTESGLSLNAHLQHELHADRQARVEVVR